MQISEIMLINQKRADNHLEQYFKTSLQCSRNFECKNFGRESGIAVLPLCSQRGVTEKCDVTGHIEY